MWYKVTRALIHDQKPCEEAVLKKFSNYHIRTLKSFEENDKYFSNLEGTWLSKGTEHGFTKEGYITRREGDEECWAVNIKNLKQLQDFIDKYGEIVLSDDEITIYDDYLE